MNKKFNLANNVAAAVRIFRARRVAAPIDRLPPERLGIGMETMVRSSHTRLFTVQLWLEELGDGQAEWRGKVQNVENGEEHYFRQWAAVGRLLRGMVPRAEDSLQAKGPVKAKQVIQSPP